MTKYFLRGRSSPGMFPNERIVEVTDHEGKEVSLVVEESAVVQKDLEDLVRVTLVERDNGKSLVLLPGEVFGSGPYISVDSEQLILV